MVKQRHWIVDRQKRFLCCLNMPHCKIVFEQLLRKTNLPGPGIVRWFAVATQVRHELLLHGVRSVAALALERLLPGVQASMHCQVRVRFEALVAKFTPVVTWRPVRTPTLLLKRDYKFNLPFLQPRGKLSSFRLTSGSR